MIAIFNCDFDIVWFEIRALVAFILIKQYEPKSNSSRVFVTLLDTKEKMNRHDVHNTYSFHQQERTGNTDLRGRLSECWFVQQGRAMKTVKVALWCYQTVRESTVWELSVHSSCPALSRSILACPSHLVTQVFTAATAAFLFVLLAERPRQWCIAGYLSLRFLSRVD